MENIWNTSKILFYPGSLWLKPVQKMLFEQFAFRSDNPMSFSGWWPFHLTPLQGEQNMWMAKAPVRPKLQMLDWICGTWNKLVENSILQRDLFSGIPTEQETLKGHQPDYVSKCSIAAVASMSQAGVWVTKFVFKGHKGKSLRIHCCGCVHLLNASVTKEH